MIKLYALSSFKAELKGVIRDIRVTWALEELGEPYERIVMDPMKREHKDPKFRAINPFGKVPAIEDDGFSLFESSAICAYLADKRGKMIPKAGTRERNLYDQWVSYTISTFEPLVWRVFTHDFFTDRKDPAAAKVRDDFLGYVDAQLKTLDEVLADRQFLLGDTFSMVDVQFGSVARVVAHTEVTAKYPRVDAYLKKICARPGFVKALAANGEA